MIRQWVRTEAVATIGLAVLFLALWAAPAAAQTEAPDITVSVEDPSRPELPYRLVAQLTTPDGSAVNGVDVRFGIHTELFGERTAVLGSATTDSTGTARLNVQPRQETFDVEASFSGDETLAARSIVETVRFPPDAVVAGGLTHETHSLLAPVQQLMPWVITAVVALLWALLIGLAAHTVARIRLAARVPDLVADARTED